MPTLSKDLLPIFMVNVDEVEQLTSLDFNNLLDDNAVEDEIEDDIERIW